MEYSDDLSMDLGAAKRMLRSDKGIVGQVGKWSFQRWFTVKDAKTIS